MWLCIKCNEVYTRRIDFIMHSSKDCSREQLEGNTVIFEVNDNGELTDVASTSCDPTASEKQDTGYYELMPLELPGNNSSSTSVVNYNSLEDTEASHNEDELHPPDPEHEEVDTGAVSLSNEDNQLHNQIIRQSSNYISSQDASFSYSEAPDKELASQGVASTSSDLTTTNLIDSPDVINEQNVLYHELSPEFIPDDNDAISSSDEDYELPNRSLQDKPHVATDVTSHQLTGTETYPETTEKPRKRLRKPGNWARNIQKQKRARGEGYVSSRNKIIEEVKMKGPCPPTCRKACSKKMSEEERKTIFKSYYTLANYNRQRDFIHSNTDLHKKKCTTTENSRRNVSINFFLPVMNERILVCKTMFLNTLGINKGVVDIAMKKRTSENTGIVDKRGKHIKKKTPSITFENVKRHIQSFPTVPSHYCRSTTQRHYLDQNLNITLMYRLYSELCDSKGEEKVELAMYRKIFNECFNLGFHRPKKDQCRLCVHYDNAPAEEKELLENDHKAHLANKDKARAEKLKSKEDAEKSDGSHISANFDLQQVLLVPSDPKNNALFYKRRLATYNFTIYNVVNNQGDCFMWNEVEGRRGSCEIASALLIYLKSLPTVTTHVTFFSDRCGGQNLNQFTAAMFMHAVMEIQNIQQIDMKFLVSGHSEMECDSMHSAINTEFKRVGKVSWPEDWKQIARGARRKGDKPYLVHDLCQEDIKDFKMFVKTNMTIRKKDEKANAFNWQKICWMRFRKETPFILNFKETFDGDFKQVNFNKRTRRSVPAPLQCLYQKQIEISQQKYEDLNSLFSMKPPALANAYKSFYLSLPFQNGKDRNQIDSDGSETEEF